jgi:hypothetical protein
MSDEQFKKLTPGRFRSRSGVAAIDQELITYRSVKEFSNSAQAPACVLERQASLRRLAQLCASYQGDRRAGVQALATEVTAELQFMDLYARAAVDLANNRKIPSAEVGHRVGRQLFEAQDAWIGLEQQGLVSHNTDVFSGIWGAFQSALGEHRKAVVALLIEDDLRKLQAVADAGTTDPLVAAILREALRNGGAIAYAETGGQASNARIIGAGDKPEHRQTGKKYLLETQLGQNAGSVERESTLLHELIHISVQEKFENTAVHLAIAKGMEKSAITALSEKRTAQIEALEGLKDHLRDVLGPSQFSMFDGNSGKILYCVKGNNTLKSYADRLGKQGRISKNEEAYILELANSGCNNTLVEFDTTISQMAFAVERWGVPADNPFRQKLDEVAREAYAYRGSLGGTL